MELKRFCTWIDVIAGHLLFVTALPTLLALISFAAAGFSLSAVIVLYVFVPLITSDMPRVCKCLVLFHVFTGSYVLIVITKSFLVELTKAVIVQWIVIVLTEIIVDQLFEFMHSSDPSPELGVYVEEWELMAVVRSTNNGYESKQFYPATVCDPLVAHRSDPFWPHHVSVMYTFEIRRRSMISKEINVWRVSLISGAQKKLPVSFNLTVLDAPFQRGFDAGAIGSYQSRDVLLMLLPKYDPPDKELLVVYDLRHEKKTITKLPDVLLIGTVVSVTCQERLVDENRTVRGWRIVLVNAFVNDVEEEDAFHLLFTSTVMDVGTSGDVAVVSSRVISFGVFDGKPELIPVRTSDGLFGIYAKDNDAQHDVFDDGPAVLYDHFQGVFVFCPTLDDLKDLDGPFDSYSLTASQITDDRLCPNVINDRECIEAFEDGQFFRIQLQPQTLKYTAALAVFRSNPDMKKSMNAEEFRQLTGVAGMDAHFE